MDAVIAPRVIPHALSRQEVIRVLWLEASSVNESITVGPMRRVRATLVRKHLLDVMIALIPGTFNPNPFCLVYGCIAILALLCDVSATWQTGHALRVLPTKKRWSKRCASLKNDFLRADASHTMP